MRIGCLQFAPQVGDVDNNLNRADSVLSKANPDDLDLLVLPELAFSGYNFKSLQDITPFLEPSGSGITSLWARTIALKYNCVVTVGYPEKVDVTPKWPTGPEYYNSAIVVNGDGETIANYRKSFLYATDETWALEGGQGFYEGFIPGLGNTSIGICMDLNPYKFEAPWHAFEFAFHVLEVESNVVIVSMAWMTREEPRRFSRKPNEPDMDTLTYWVKRLEPLIRSDNKDEIIVVFCNRTGNEDEVMYAGTSAVIGIQEGEVKVYGLLGRGEKELLVVDTNNAPYAKLVHRPDSGGMSVEAGTLRKPDGSGPLRDSHESGNESDGKPSSTHDGSDAAGPSSQSHSSAPPLPPLPTLPQELMDEAPKRRHPPAISIPQEPDLVRLYSARSPGTDSFNIPTPSMPSPTPMAVRPRLIIPESPPILPHQYPPDHPISAASLRSERSITSVLSDQSETSQASTQTIRSNPRPPEDSTPYPHSGAPLSGYPGKAYDEKRIYGGHVTFDNSDYASSLGDISPASPRWFWQADDRLHTPLTSTTWTPGTAVGRRPEPFPWPQITGNAATPISRIIEEDREPPASPLAPAPVSALNNARHLNSQSPQSNTSSNRTTRKSKTGRSSSSTRPLATTNSKTPKKKTPSRPSSPKSRNASRTGMRDRSDSSLDNAEFSTALSHHLEDISYRAESANRMRHQSSNGTPCPDRPPSPKSRNCSRSRPGEPADFEQQTIHIAASPSVLRTDAHTPYRPMSRTGHHQRSNSRTNTNGSFRHINGDRSGTPNSPANIVRPPSRAISRGRAPDPKVLPTNGKMGAAISSSERASSTDSSRNGPLHVRKHSTQPPESAHSSVSRASRASRRSSRGSRQTPITDFEVVEAVVCPNCPVHGRNPSVDGFRPAESSSNSVHAASDSNHSDASSLKSGSSRTNRGSPRTPAQQVQEKKPMEAKSASSLKNGCQALSLSEGAETSDYSSSGDTLQTVSSLGQSPSTPAFFNPDTPKAMVLKTDDLDVIALPNGLSDVLDKTPTNYFAEAGSILAIDRPKSQVV